MTTFSLQTALLKEQQESWPKSGRHIMAQYDDQNIVVYQAYCQEIGRYAAENQQFGGAFSFNRMSWIKPNFLWMMYRSGWGTKPSQEITLAVTISRVLFDEILSLAVPSTYQEHLYGDLTEWKDAVANSEVRLQWDPDHGPIGEPLSRRAIQLGLRGDILERYARAEVVRIDDISDFVAEQRRHFPHGISELRTPAEVPYRPAINDPLVRIGIEQPT